MAQETRVGTTPYDVVLERGTHRLLRYRRETPAPYAEPVLFCYALINRPYILDLQPDKSVVRHYLARGFDVYMIDWGVPSDGDRLLTLEHYVCGFLKEAVEFVLRERVAQDLHLLGYCMGGTMSALFAALYPALVKTLTLLAAPIDFGGRESLLNLWTDRAVLRRRRLHRHVRQLSRLVPAVLLSEHEPDPKPSAEELVDVREHGRPPIHLPTTSRWSAGSTTTSRSPARRSASS